MIRVVIGILAMLLVDYLVVCIMLIEPRDQGRPCMHPAEFRIMYGKYFYCLACKRFCSLEDILNRDIDLIGFDNPSSKDRLDAYTNIG